MNIPRDPATGRRYRLSIKRDGKRKYTMLYRRWMRGRTRGHSTRSAHLYAGLEVGWKTFAEFRRWALKHGFCKERSSPDRQDSTKGYVPGNVEFVPIDYNTVRALRGDDYWRGEEPPDAQHPLECPCDDCTEGGQGSAVFAVPNASEPAVCQ